MEKLYYENQYIKNFTAEVISVTEKDGKYHVVLDKTAFFPGGGGQPCDTGTIEGLYVIDVYEENGTIYHVMESKLLKIHKVKGSIDWTKRFDGMQQHLGQHVLSGCFFKLFKANTCGFHLGSEISTVDIEGILDETTIREAEKAANEVIHSNIAVEFLTPDKKELKKLKLRRALPDTNEQIRVVILEDLDINACCGVHPNSTLELQAIKIRRWEKHKDATRIEYVAGKRAIDDYFKKDNYINLICKYLNSGEEDALKGIKNMNDALKDALDANKKALAELAEYKVKELIENAEKFNDMNLVKLTYENEDVKYISKLASKLVEYPKTISLIVVKNNDRANFVFSKSKDVPKISMNTILKDVISLVDGRGGGSELLAQGAGKNNGNVDCALDSALIKIKNM